MFNFHTFLYFLTAATSTILGAFVFFRNPKSPVNRSWCRLGLVVSLWAVGFGMMLFSDTKTEAVFWGSLSHVGASLISVTYLHFILSLLGDVKKKIRMLYLTYGIGLFLAGASLTPLLIKDYSPKMQFNYYVQPGILYIWFTLNFFLVVVYAFSGLIRGLKHTFGYLGNQLRYVLIASLLGFGAGATTFPLVFDIQFYPFGGLVSLYNIIISYAIIRYRLMDIRVAVTRAGIFAIVYTLVLGIPFGIMIWARSFIKNLGYYGMLVPLLFGMFVATAGPLIYNYLRRQAEKRLRKEEFQRHERLRGLSQKAMRVIDLRILLGLIVRQLVKILKVDFSALYLRKNGGSYSLRAYFADRKRELILPDIILSEWAISKDIELRRLPIDIEELKHTNQNNSVNNHTKLYEEFSLLKAAYLIPSFLRNRSFGLLILGRTSHGIPLSQGDLNLLCMLSNQIALAIENALLYEKEKTSIAEQSRRQALADMAPGASHQFNNRLIGISSTTDNLLDLIQTESQDMSKEDIIKIATDALRQITAETIKGRQITEAILQRAKVKMEFARVDLIKVIQNAINLTKIRRTKESLGGANEPEFIFNHPDTTPLLNLCEGLIQDVYENIFNNSVDAIVMKHKYILDRKIDGANPYQGKIALNLIRQGPSIKIQIEDNGTGIQKENLAKLFTPYFTTKATAEKGISGGAGLGLWVMRDFVERQGGAILVESEYTKWTRFTITLPIDFKPKE